MPRRGVARRCDAMCGTGEGGHCPIDGARALSMLDDGSARCVHAPLPRDGYHIRTRTALSPSGVFGSGTHCCSM